MSRFIIDDRYIYLREGKKCFFCGRTLKKGQMTLDHYLPKSHGGSYQLFNLVCACRTCNKEKKNEIPSDFKVVNIKLFKKAVVDGKLNYIKHDRSVAELIELSMRINNMKVRNKDTCFYGPGISFYVSENNILKVYVSGVRNDI